MRALPILFFITVVLLHSACNPFMDSNAETMLPDTAVVIRSLSPQVCQVKRINSDTTYYITSYWTDKLTGRIIYKMKYEPYKMSRLHGVKMIFDEKGDTLAIEHFEDGVRVDSSVYRYPNGQTKQKIFYSKKKDGNILWELNYHPNGRKKTDLIPYTDGLITGEVTYYDTSAQSKPTETYFYVESEIVGIKIYNDQYRQLDIRKNAMLSAYQKDSARIAMAMTDSSDNSFRAVVPADSKREAFYDVGEPDEWDIMKKDPNFILDFEKGNE